MINPLEKYATIFENHHHVTLHHLTRLNVGICKLNCNMWYFVLKLVCTNLNYRVLDCILDTSTASIFRAQEPKAPVTYCDHALSGVCRPLDNLHFQLLLQNRLMDFDETWYGWSTHGPLQVLLFFGKIHPGADPGRGKNRSQGVPFFKELQRLQQQTECIAVIYKHLGRSVVIFGFIRKSNFWRVFDVFWT